MAGKSPVAATEEQKTALKALAGGVDRAEADRARAVLLTLDGWTSARIAQAFGVREDTVRVLSATGCDRSGPAWRSAFMRGGIDALKASVAPGPVPLKAEAALRVWQPYLPTKASPGLLTAGGISTHGLSSKTMQVQRVPGLYAIGEAVDVTGWLGGYNFQWAFNSTQAGAKAWPKQKLERTGHLPVLPTRSQPETLWRMPCPALSAGMGPQEPTASSHYRPMHPAADATASAPARKRETTNPSSRTILTLLRRLRGCHELGRRSTSFAIVWRQMTVRFTIDQTHKEP